MRSLSGGVEEIPVLGRAGDPGVVVMFCLNLQTHSSADIEEAGVRVQDEH